MYAIKTQQFEGPLDLLLTLIEKRKVSVNELSLSDIADNYLEYLKQLENFPLEEVARFASIASTLILIKSRSLLPTLELTEEEEQSIDDLERRLKLYRRTRELSVHVNNLFGQNPLFSRKAFSGVKMGFLEPKDVDAIKLHSVLSEILNNLPEKKEELPKAEVKKRIISIEEKTDELIERIRHNIEISFSDFSKTKSQGGGDRKIEIVISFLAMLELIKQGMVAVSQECLFDDMSICKYQEV